MKQLLYNKITVLAIFSGMAIVAISFMKNALELEDAEQAYYSQWWRWGYDDQPPLYTWIQLLMNSVIGVSKLSFSLLRGLIFSGILVLLYQFSVEVLKNRTKASLAVLSLVLLPAFIDFTFRRLSHTALLCLLILGTYYMLHRLLQRKSTLNYMLLGVIVSMGILTKYNYVLLLGALCVVLPFDRSLRQLVFNKKIVWSAIIVLIAVSPHIYWLFGHHDYMVELQNSIRIKTEGKIESSIPVLSPFLALVLTLIQLLAPILGLVLVFLLAKKIKYMPSFTINWLVKLLLSQFLVVALVFVILGIQKVEVRWLLPLFLPFLVLLPDMIVLKKPKQWEYYGFYTFLFVLFFQTIRTPSEKLLGISSSVHYGFEAISEKLEQDYPKKQWILPNVTYGGNIRLLNPQREVFSLDDFSLPAHKRNSIDCVWVTINKENPLKMDKPTDSIPNFGKEREHLFFYEF